MRTLVRMDLEVRRRARRKRSLRELAEPQEWVVSRRQLYALGFCRAEVRWEIQARRWQRIGRHCIGLHNGPLSAPARHWVAVLEGGPRAVIDGESSLVLAGLRNYTVEKIRVSVPRGARIRHRPSSINIRQTRRWDRDDMVDGGIPRTEPAVAAVRGALWARSDRQAVLLLTMTVQQGLARAEDLAVEMLRIRRDRRRPLLNQLILELLGGVRSLGELDVVRGCRERGIPEPDMQVCRRTTNGKYYLDFRWKRWRVVVEVDGIQHAWVANIVGDALRHNRLAIDGDTVLRLPVLGLRAEPEAFFGQIAEALVVAGCPLPAVGRIA